MNVLLEGLNGEVCCDIYMFFIRVSAVFIVYPFIAA
jgi:hypothetical protein